MRSCHCAYACARVHMCHTRVHACTHVRLHAWSRSAMWTVSGVCTMPACTCAWCVCVCAPPWACACLQGTCVAMHARTRRRLLPRTVVCIHVQLCMGLCPACTTWKALPLAFAMHGVPRSALATRITAWSDTVARAFQVVVPAGAQHMSRMMAQIIFHTHLLSTLWSRPRQMRSRSLRRKPPTQAQPLPSKSSRLIRPHPSNRFCLPRAALVAVTVQMLGA